MNFGRMMKMSDEDKKEEEFKEEDYIESGLPEIEEVLAKTSEEVKHFWLVMFLLLNKHKRYHDVIEENFEIQKVIDEEKQMIDVVISEKPKKPKVSGGDMMRLHAVLMKYGLKEQATACLRDITDVLKGKEVKSNIVTSVSEADFKEELKKK